MSDILAAFHRLAMEAQSRAAQRPGDPWLEAKRIEALDRLRRAKRMRNHNSAGGGG